jgi:DNA-binding CsgD family transcriptional regulator
MKDPRLRAGFSLDLQKDEPMKDLDHLASQPSRPPACARCFSSPQPVAAAAIFIDRAQASSLEQTPAEQSDYLRTRFGFTRAEARVALATLSGCGRGRVAAQLYISESTVRTHLSRIFEKTEVRRQAELVHLLMRHLN